MMSGNRKKIVFSIDTLLIGGIEKVMIELLKNISLVKYDVTLLIGYNLEELEKLKEDIPKEIEIKYIFNEKIHTTGKKRKALGKLSGFGKILYEGMAVIRKKIFKRRLLEIIRDADTVVDFDMTLASYAKYIHNNIITFCHFSPKNYNRGIKRRQEKHGKKLMNYDKIIVISDDMKKEAEDMYPYLKEKLCRIYNSFDIEKLYEKANEYVENQKINDNYILSIGRLEETQKDFTTLIKAYKRAEDYISEKLFIIGDGRHRKNLEELIAKLDLEKKVILLGFQKNPYPWIKNSSFFVHSSKFEGLPTVLIEALILKKAIISTDCPTGPREILEDGKNGILVEVGNYKEFGDKIKLLSNNIELKKQYEEEGYRSIHRFNSKEVVREIERLF